jgi:hypothetical protein
VKRPALVTEGYRSSVIDTNGSVNFRVAEIRLIGYRPIF